MRHEHLAGVGGVRKLHSQSERLRQAAVEHLLFACDPGPGPGSGCEAGRPALRLAYDCCACSAHRRCQHSAWAEPA